MGLLGLVALPISAKETDSVEAADAEVEVVETVEDIETVDTSGTDEDSGFSVVKIIARNHAASVHLPIGLMMGVLLLELFALVFNKIPVGQSGLILSIATLASFVPAALSGWLRSKEIYASSEAPALFFEHRNLMISAAVVFFCSVVLRLLKKDAISGRIRLVYLGLVVMSVVLVVLGGHHGGQLVYGEAFLPY